MFQDGQILLPLITAASALLGAAIGSLASVWSTLVTKRSEERKHLRELIFRTALDHWREDRALAKYKIERNPTQPISMPPLADYILALNQYGRLLDRHLSAEELRVELEKIKELDAVTSAHWGSEADPQ